MIIPTVKTDIIELYICCWIDILERVVAVHLAVLAMFAGFADFAAAVAGDCAIVGK